MYSNVLAIFAAVALAGANDLLQAANNKDYKRVFDGHFEAKWAITQQSKEVFVNSSKLISKINVTDLREEKDGIAQIVSGGLGHPNVTISLKSPAAFRGYDFLVEVFADNADYIDRGQRGLEPEPEIPQEPGKEDTPIKLPADATGPTNKVHFPRNQVPTQNRIKPDTVTTSTEKALPKEIEIPEEDEQNPKIQAYIGYNPPRKLTTTKTPIQKPISVSF